jgi:hypothetical protein
MVDQAEGEMDNDFQKYADLTQDALMTAIGRELMSGTLQGQPLSDEDYRKFGTNWFTSFRDTLRTVICKPEVMDQLSGANKDRNTVIGIVCNVLFAAGLHYPVPVGSLGVAIVNYGCTLLCQSSEPADARS